MKFFSRNILVAALALLVGMLPAIGQSVISGVLTNGVNLIKTGPGAVYELEVYNQDAATQTLTIYDNSSSTSTNTVKPAWTYYTIGRATNSVVFTNIVGVVQTNTTIGLARTTVSVSAVTNEATRVYRVTIPTATKVTIQPNEALTFGLGFQLHLLGTNATYNGFYNPLP